MRSNVVAYTFARIFYFGSLQRAGVRNGGNSSNSNYSIYRVYDNLKEVS